MMTDDIRDTRVRAPISGAYDLAALDAALGNHGLCGSATEVVAVEGSPVTRAQLDAAIAACEPPAPPTPEEKLAALGLTPDDIRAVIEA